VGRALGVPCLVGCGVGSVTALAGRTVTVDANAGVVYAGALAVATPREEDDPRLARLTAWAAARAPLTVLTDDDPQAARAHDLAHVEGAEDPARLPALLAGHSCVRGGAIESEAGVAAALAAGVTTIVARHPLPVLLAAIQARAGAA
ncbi:MAG: PEP-utilizing enzyme, partial [Gammaproteobacteria bacterium]